MGWGRGPSFGRRPPPLDERRLNFFFSELASARQHQPYLPAKLRESDGERLGAIAAGGTGEKRTFIVFQLARGEDKGRERGRKW